MKYIKVELCNSIEETNPYYIGNINEDSFILKVSNTSNDNVKLISIRFAVRSEINSGFVTKKSRNLKIVEDNKIYKNEDEDEKNLLNIGLNSFRNIVVSKEYLIDKIGNLDFKVTIVECKKYNLYDVIIENK